MRLSRGKVSERRHYVTRLVVVAAFRSSCGAAPSLPNSTFRQQKGNSEASERREFRAKVREGGDMGMGYYRGVKG